MNIKGKTISELATYAERISKKDPSSQKILHITGRIKKLQDPKRKRFKKSS